MSYLSDIGTKTGAEFKAHRLRIEGIEGRELANKVDAVGAPTVTDDTATGYEVGSLWIDVTGDAAYTCVDATNGAAKWTNITLTADEVDVTTDLTQTTATNQLTIESSTGSDIVVAEASATIAGLMSTTHHDKLDGIATGANNYSLPASVVHDNESGALHATDALRVSGTTVSLYKGDGTSESITTQDTNTTYTAGTALDLSGTTFNVDLSELGTVTTELTSADYIIALDGTVGKKITLDNMATEFGTIKGWTTNTGTVSSLGDLGITSTSTEINKLDGLTATTTELNYVDGITSNIQTQLDSKTSNTGTVTGVTGGTGLSGSITTSGTLALDFSELTDKTTAVAGTTEMIIQDGTTESRKALSEIDLSVFNNNSGWTSNTGTVGSLGDLGITATAAEVNYTAGVTSSVQTQLDDKISETGGLFTGDVTYIDTTISTDIDCSTGNSFNKTVTANFTLTFSNVPASGAAYVIVVKLENAGSYVITWPTSIKWSGGTAPSFTATGIDTVTLYTVDGGTTWYGIGNIGYA